MAVLHHAFRCPVTPQLKTDVIQLTDAWEVGDRERMSAFALKRYAQLEPRDDIQTAFHLSRETSATSWLQPNTISPGLAALVVLAHSFIRLSTLSASSDTNHDRLATQLPILGWAAGDVGSLIRGEPIEDMLRNYSPSAGPFNPGGFRSTGGWTPGRTAQTLKARVDGLPPSKASKAAYSAWELLKETRAIDDARAMLSEISVDDWLVMTITQ